MSEVKKKPEKKEVEKTEKKFKREKKESTFYIGPTVKIGILENGAVFGMSSCPIESFRIHLFAAVLLILAVMILLIIIQGWFFTRRTKGVTGDIVGGISEITEVLFLLISFLALNYAY